MSDTNGDSYQSILQFDDQSPSFAHGFEAGQVWQAMRDRMPIELPVHGENLELFQRMFIRQQYVHRIEPLEDADWYVLRAMPKETQL